jgi:hypothetical protein
LPAGLWDHRPGLAPAELDDSTNLFLLWAYLLNSFYRLPVNPLTRILTWNSITGTRGVAPRPTIVANLSYFREQTKQPCSKKPARVPPGFLSALVFLTANLPNQVNRFTHPVCFRRLTTPLAYA